MAQTDTVFWFAAPEVSKSYAQFDTPAIFRITSYSSPATVTISQPAGGGMPLQMVTIPANSTADVNVTKWLNSVENKPANTNLNYGIKISSTAEVTVYYEVVSSTCNCNPELFVLKGKNALGTNFLIPSQTSLPNNQNPAYTPSPHPVFDIIATENNTNITITPSSNIIGHAQGVPFTITLHQGQTYSAAGTGYLGSAHLQGSVVTSDKPIGITITDDLLQLGVCSDLAGDQIVPLNLLGTEYIAMKGQLSSNEEVFLLATANGTTISQNGTYLTTINAGQTYALSVSGTATYIQASNPVYALQLTGIGCEVGTALLPQISCTGSSSVTVTRSTSEQLLVTLLVKSGGQGNFLVNGTSGVVNAAQFSPVPGTSGQWYAANVSLSASSYPVGGAIRISNTTSYFHMGMLNGSASGGTRFGYFSNYSSIDPKATTTTPNICLGQDIHLFGDSLAGATYNWTGPNGFTSNIRTPIITGTSTSSSGTYTLTITANNCTGTGTVNVNVVSSFDVQINDTICENNYILFAGDTLRKEGTYKHKFIAAGGCDSNVTMHIVSTKLPEAFFILPSIACLSDSLDLFTKPMAGVNYSWDLADATIKKGTGIGPYVVYWKTEGRKIINLTASNKCGNRSLSDTIEVFKNPVVEITDVKKGEVCGNDTVKFTATNNPAYTYSWEPKEYFYLTNGPLGEGKLPLRSKVKVIATDANGCQGFSNLDVYNNPGCCNIVVPSAFTPNDDTRNDFVRILSYAYNQQLLYFRIYNRWGQQVFETTNVNSGWDGKYKGKPQEVGTYYYIVKYKCVDGTTEVQKGDITLLR